MRLNRNRARVSQPHSNLTYHYVVCQLMFVQMFRAFLPRNAHKLFLSIPWCKIFNFVKKRPHNFPLCHFAEALWSASRQVHSLRPPRVALQGGAPNPCPCEWVGTGVALLARLWVELPGFSSGLCSVSHSEATQELHKCTSHAKFNLNSSTLETTWCEFLIIMLASHLIFCVFFCDLGWLMHLT